VILYLKVHFFIESAFLRFNTSSFSCDSGAYSPYLVEVLTRSFLCGPFFPAISGFPFCIPSSVSPSFFCRLQLDSWSSVTFPSYWPPFSLRVFSVFTLEATSAFSSSVLTASWFCFSEPPSDCLCFMPYWFFFLHFVLLSQQRT